jgi:hypothetical protein
VGQELERREGEGGERRDTKRERRCFLRNVDSLMNQRVRRRNKSVAAWGGWGRECDYEGVALESENLEETKVKSPISLRSLESFLLGKSLWMTDLGGLWSWMR